jgi:hypothetical protein
MLEARSFFEDEVLSTMPSQPGPEGNKTPLWEQAKMVKISVGDAVVVPIKYEKQLSVKAEGEKSGIDLQKSSYLLIYKDKKQNMQAEWVRLAPIGEKKNDKFVGIVAVNEWNGKAKHAFAFNQNGEILALEEKNTLIWKSSLRNSYMCYSLHYTDVYRRGNDWIVYGYSTRYCIDISSYGGDLEQERNSESGGSLSGGGGAFPPDDYTQLLDCAGVAGGTAVFSEECQTCIGGTTGIEKCPTDSLKKIMKKKNDCLTTDQNNKVKDVFNNYLNTEIQKIDCDRKYIYQKIEASGIKIGICVDATLKKPAAYRPNEKNLLFQNESMLTNASQFEHEFFHLFQDAYYTGGIEQYLTNGFMNIEFEQALFNDISTGGLPGGFGPTAMRSSAPKALKDEYRTWVESITNNYKTKPKVFSDFQGKYDYFLEQFSLHSGYSTNIDGKIRPGFQPNALLSIFSKSNCDLQH